MALKTFQVLLIVLVSALKMGAQSSGYFEDGRDSHKYKYVTIGEQVWMAENLNYRVESGSYIYAGGFDRDTVENDEYFGRLYTFDAAQNACPEGWHLPSDNEWTILIDFLGGEEGAGGSLKKTGNEDDKTGLWQSPNKGATNESGFSAVPGGYRGTDGHGRALNHYAIFWSSTVGRYSDIWSRELTYQYGYVKRIEKNSEHANSVRCVKD